MQDFARFSDIDELAEVNAKFGWQVELRQLEVGAYHGEAATATLGEVSVQRVFTEKAVHVLAASPAGNTMILLPLQAPLGCKEAGRLWATRCAVIVPERADIDLLTPAGTEMLAIRVPNDELKALGHHLGVDEIGVPASHTARVALDQVQVPGFDNLDRGVFEYLRRGNSLQYQPVPTRNYPPHALLLSWIDTLLSARSSRLADAEDTGYHSSSLARATRAIIDERWKAEITIGEMASTLAVSPRTLHHAFTQTFGLGPMRYISLRRLGEARRRLKQCHPSSTSVTAVAGECGCNHLGRFSVNYKAMYGESPSATLLRLEGQ